MNITVQNLDDQLRILGYLTKSEMFKSRAYYKAANSIQALNDAELLSLSDFNHIPGIGNSINEKIKIFKVTGYLPGIDREAYDKTVNQGMIKERVGFNTTRIPLLDALKIIDTKLAVIKDDTEFVGSIRRAAPYIADIDALVEVSKYDDMVAFLEEEFRMLVKGESKTSFIVDETNLIQLDINCYEKNDKAFSLMHHTGSAEHNIKLRAIAKKKGLMLNQYGLFDGDNRIHCDTEEEIFNQLGLQYVAPNFRK